MTAFAMHPQVLDRPTLGRFADWPVLAVRAKKADMRLTTQLRTLWLRESSPQAGASQPLRRLEFASS